MTNNTTPPAAPALPDLLSSSQVSARLGVSVRRVQYLVKLGRLTATRVGNALGFDRAQIDAFAARHRPPGRPRKADAPPAEVPAAADTPAPEAAPPAPNVPAPVDAPVAPRRRGPKKGNANPKDGQRRKTSDSG